MKPLGTNDPRAIATYRLVGLLGGGGMGRVYLGQSRAGRYVAIKVIRPELAEDPVFRRRFAREVAAARAVNPLYTAAVVDADTEAEAPWLATTYIDGPSLDTLVTEEGALPTDAVFTLAAGLAEALHSMHRVGLVHRDLKPGNVLLDDDGPHIIDFGISMIANASRLTTSMIVGTPSYMAPERIQGDEGGPPGDIFSLGATLVFAATGKTLVNEGTMFQQISQIANGAFQIVGVPAPLRPLITRCLSQRPIDRPTAEEIGRFLAGSQVAVPVAGWYRGSAAPQAPARRPIIDNLPGSPVGKPAELRLSRRRVLALGGVAGVAAAGGAIATGVALSADRGTGGPGRPIASVQAPGAVLWQVVVDSSATDTDNGGDGLAIAANGLLISATAREVVAVDTAGNQSWRRLLTAQRPVIWQWGDDVAVTDAERIYLVSGADGQTRITIEAVGIERTAAQRDNADRLPIQISRLVFSGDLVFAHLGTATVAYDRSGVRQWRRPRPTAANGSRPTAGKPLIANEGFVATHDAVTSADGLRRSIEINLLDRQTGLPVWPAPARDSVLLDDGRRGGGDRQPSPPEEPGGSAGPGRQRPPGQPPAGPDPAWNRSSMSFCGEFLVARDSRQVRVLRLTDGGEVWREDLPRPVASMAAMGDLVIIGGDQIYAFLAKTGVEVWSEDVRGARLAVSPDAERLFVVHDEGMVVYNAMGETLWTSTQPERIVRAGGVARVLVRGSTGLILGRRSDRGVDVVAVGLEVPA
jgi:predicted Ser/Thr protein kinase